MPNKKRGEGVTTDFEFFEQGGQLLSTPVNLDTEFFGIFVKYCLKFVFLPIFPKIFSSGGHF